MTYRTMGIRPLLFAAVSMMGIAPISGAADAVRILEATGVRGGLIVHIGCGDGHLTADLRANERYLVHGLDADPAKIEKAREHIRSRGLYGPVSAARLRGTRLPYIDGCVNLIVAEDLGGVSEGELMRVLAPEGVTYVERDGAWTKTIKPRPPEIDEWTHALHGPDNNAVARDAAVGPPEHLQWVGGVRWGRSHDHLSSVSAVVSSGGRIVSIQDEGPAATVALPSAWRLVARDAFNGVVLWKREVGPWEDRLRGFRTGPAALSRRLVAFGDRVYVTFGYGGPVTALDAATGEAVRTYDRTRDALEIVLDGGTLFVVAGDALGHGAASTTRLSGTYRSPGGKRLIALRAETGKVLWEKADADTDDLMPTALAVASDRAYFQNAKELIALDASSGRVRWRAPRPTSANRWSWSAPTLVVFGDVVLSADRASSSIVDKTENDAAGRVAWVVGCQGGDSPPGELIALSADTGARLWSCPCREGYNSPVDVFVAGGLVWTGDLVQARRPGITEGRDPMTGAVERTRPPDATFFRAGMPHHRCYRNRATDRYLILGRSGVEFIDVASGEAIAHHWVRGACQFGILPCNGLLYAPTHPCACYIEAKLNGFVALAPRRRADPDAGSAGDRIERGSASLPAPAPSEDAWPTYRGDAARSGRTRAKVPVSLAEAWRTEIGGRLTSPVIADGKVFVASIDAHAVHALDARTGAPLWRRTAGGRVDSPPTIHRGLALFGCADGWVYGLRASDGETVWRIRAAPEDLRLVSYGQVESVWPVHGNILVLGDSAYFAAGRSSFLDGGIHIFRVDAANGTVRAHRRIDHRDPKTGREPQETIQGFGMPGALPDVLSSDGTSIYMRHLRFDADLVEQPGSEPHLFSPAGFLDDSWWHRTYWLFGTRMISGWAGWPQAGNQAPAGRLLVFDGSSVYGFGRLNQYGRHGAHVGLDDPLPPWPLPPKDGSSRKAEYKLFARPNPAERPKARDCRWIESVGIWVRAMVLADGALFVSGPPDPFAGASAPAGDGARLQVFSTADGRKLAERRLASEPVFDGMAASGGRLFISTVDGRVCCWAGE
ncbi:MAG: PQQ-binding-like beta-propeller repeat protein [Planctomycetes bacterium]|nr:PQQ-binding-like beta-propeller repeat protein [Planctomycetota bacterium]